MLSNSLADVHLVDACNVPASDAWPVGEAVSDGWAKVNTVRKESPAA